MTSNAKINLVINGKSFFLQNFEKKKFILGSIEQQKRLYFFDKTYNIYSLEVDFKFFTTIGEFVEGKGSLPTEIPEELKDTVARILNEFGFNKEAFKLVQNQDMKF